MRKLNKSDSGFTYNLGRFSAGSFTFVKDVGKGEKTLGILHGGMYVSGTVVKCQLLVRPHFTTALHCMFEKELSVISMTFRNSGLRLWSQWIPHFRSVNCKVDLLQEINHSTSANYEGRNRHTWTSSQRECPEGLPSPSFGGPPIDTYQATKQQKSASCPQVFSSH